MKVKEKQTGITCPGANETTKKKCTLVVDDLTIAKLLNDDSGLARHNDALLDSYVQQRGDLQWCTAPSCSNVIRLVARATGVGGSDEVTCTCGQQFCFGCGASPHRPATCEMIELWKQKAGGGDEDVSKQLIATVSRPCPHCKSPIEKNSGCNHMTCSSCQFHFCWNVSDRYMCTMSLTTSAQCMKKFGSGPKGGSDGYSSHKCNSMYIADKDTAMLQNELKVYTFYHDRFLNHSKSKQVVADALKNINAITTKLVEKGGFSWRHAQYVEEAYKQDVENRSTLVNSYIFGYYRPKMMPFVNKLIFEDLQAALERHTEILTASVEDKSIQQLINDETIVEDRMKALSHARMSETDRVSMRAHEYESMHT